MNSLIINPALLGNRVINSGDFWQWTDTGHGKLLHQAEHPVPRALAHRRAYRCILQTKPVYMTPLKWIKMLEWALHSKIKLIKLLRQAPSLVTSSMGTVA